VSRTARGWSPAESGTPNGLRGTRLRETDPVRCIVAVFREFERAARDAELSVTQYRFLLFLRNGPMRAGEIAANSLLTKATISGRIQELRELGLIETQAEASDLRVTRLTLTKAGRDRMDRFERRLLRVLKELIGGADEARILGALGELYREMKHSREARFADGIDNGGQEGR
jgi:DNA-binding MarR family transcriptional regulator